MQFSSTTLTFPTPSQTHFTGSFLFSLKDNLVLLTQLTQMFQRKVKITSRNGWTTFFNIQSATLAILSVCVSFTLVVTYFCFLRLIVHKLYTQHCILVLQHKFVTFCSSSNSKRKEDKRPSKETGHTPPPAGKRWPLNSF